MATNKRVLRVSGAARTRPARPAGDQCGSSEAGVFGVARFVCRTHVLLLWRQLMRPQTHVHHTHTDVARARLNTQREAYLGKCQQEAAARADRRKQIMVR